MSSRIRFVNEKPKRVEIIPLEVEKIPRIALRPAEAARAIGIGERTLSDLTRAGRIPHFRLGAKVVLYSTEQLATWAREQTQQVSEQGNEVDDLM